MNSKDKEKIEKIIRESILEEGIFDWISKWKQSKMNDFFETKQTLSSIYSLISKYKKDYPKTTKRILSNIKRVLQDLETINGLKNKGIDEKTFLSKDLGLE